MHIYAHTRETERDTEKQRDLVGEGERKTERGGVGGGARGREGEREMERERGSLEEGRSRLESSSCWFSSSQVPDTQASRQKVTKKKIEITFVLQNTVLLHDSGRIH